MSIDLKARKTAKIGGFKGVDFSSSPLLVAQNRAINSTNFIFENGVNRKRNGWIENFRIGTGNINGIFECILDNQKMIIVYANKSFYKVTKNERDEYTSVNITNTSTNQHCKVDISRLEDKRCQMFINSNRLYFVGCGDYLTYGKYGESFELRRVEDDDLTYIPTTTINIDADGTVGDIVETFEAPNLLSCKRKNTFVGNVANSTFTVDAESIDDDIVIKVEHETLDDSGLLITKIYLSDGNNLKYDDTTVGVINFETGKIKFTIDTSPVIQSEANLIVTFGCKVDGYAERINNTNIGIMFGINGNPDRLFVAGNENYPNYDFYSAMDNLTYFGDLNASVIGSSDSKIVGYSRLGDGTLATHKESVNGEASIYYRTGTYNTEYNSDGSLSNVIAYFPIKAGTIGEAMISQYANANLGGDKIYLSKNGVYGIVLSSNISSVERYSKERSQYISAKLKKHLDLSNAVGIAYDNRYYLAVDNVCYVADARMISQNTSDINSFNYEWYLWENMPVRVWGIVEDKLFFGTADGRVCSFDREYTDRFFEYTSPNELMLDYDNNCIVYNNKLGVKDKDIITFSTDIFIEKILDSQILKVKNNRIFVSEEDIMTIYNGTEVYVDNVGSSGLIADTKYIINSVNLSDCSFKLSTDSGRETNILTGGFRLCENLKNRECLIVNLTNTYFQVAGVKKEPEIYKIVKYNNSQSYQNPLAKFIIKNNVVATWYTPIFDFGTNQATKVLLNITVATEPSTNGQVTFGYTTKDSKLDLESQGVNIFDFASIDFTKFTFNSSFANSYTVDVKNYFNFIQFFFKSDNEFACGIQAISITYKINNTNRGVQ